MPSHTPYSIDRVPEDTRSSRMVSIFKATLSTGDLYHNLINMGSALLKYSSGRVKGRLAELKGLHTHREPICMQKATEIHKEMN